MIPPWRGVRRMTTTIVLGLLGAFIAIAIPLTLLSMREVIRRRRSMMLTDLLQTLFKDHPDIPALEFARNKYGVRSDDGPVRDDPASQSITRTRTLVASAIPYLAFSIAGFLLLALPLSALVTGGPGVGPLIVPSLLWSNSAGIAPQNLLDCLSIVGVTFLGGYIFTLRALLRAVMNFELGPITWLRAAAHLVGGVIIALLLFRTLEGTPFLSSFIKLGTTDAGALHLWLAIAFIAGSVPDFGMVTLVRYLNINYVKTIDPEVMKSAEIIPIEVIDGIDYDIRYRLEETNILDVQNLATSNPILLFVETPYGLYQSFDWVLQAQLCLVTGPKVFFELKKHNVRTILDLERAVLGDDAPERYIRMIGSVIFSEASALQRGLITTAAATPAVAAELDVASIRHAVMVMADDLHVHRLRQLWSEIGKKLGSDWLYRKSPPLVVDATGPPAAVPNAGAVAAQPPPPPTPAAANG